MMEKRMRLNLHQKLCTVAYMNDLPFAQIQPNRHSISGIEAQLMLTFAQHFNFTMDYINGFGQYGAQLSNGSWSGVIGKIMNKEIDFAIGGTIMSPERLSVVQFLYPHWIDSFTFATRPSVSKTSYDILIKPFDSNVWLGLLMAFILMFWFHQMVVIIKIPRTESRSIPVHNLFWIDLHLFLGQSYRWLQSLNISLKICAIFWLFASMILSNVYGGCLCSILAVPTQQLIDKVEKLAQACKSDQIIPLGIANASTYNVFKTSEVPSYQAISKSMIFISNYHQGLGMIMSRNANRGKSYAIIYPRERLNYNQLKYGQDRLYLPPNDGEATFFLIHLAIPVSRTFPHRKPFNSVISYLTSAGFFENWKNRENLKILFKNELDPEDFDIVDNDASKSHQTYSNDPLTMRQNVVNISLEHFGSIFYLHLVLLASSLIIFLTETMVHRRLTLKIRLIKIMVKN